MKHRLLYVNKYTLLFIVYIIILYYYIAYLRAPVDNSAAYFSADGIYPDKN